MFGLFGTKKKQVIKFEQNLCNASVNDNSVLFVRVNDVVTAKDALVEVPYTHNAFIIKGGGDCRFYKSGNYPVFDNKAEVKNWKTGLSVEVVYIPKETEVLIRWGTPTKVKYRDPVCSKVIEVGARGQFGISIQNPEQFLRKVVGARKEFDLQDFSTRFAAAVVDEFADAFLTVINTEKLIYDQFDASRKKIASMIGTALSEKFEKSWGIGLADFIIESFNISAEDMEKVESVAEEEKREARERERNAEAERLDDKAWDREKYVMQLDKEDREAFYDVLKSQNGAEAPKGANFCPHCGHSCENTASFCPNCGKPIGGKTRVVCPSCNKSNPSDAAFCVGCGKKLR